MSIPLPQLPNSSSFPPPTITPDEFNQILTKSNSVHHPLSRQAENFSLNLANWLTGSAILNLQVRRIPPHILVLIGAGRQGALAMNVIRQLIRKFDISVTAFVLPKVLKESDDEYILESKSQIEAIEKIEKMYENSDENDRRVQFAYKVVDLIELLEDSSVDIDFCLDGISLTSGKYHKSGKKWYGKLVSYLTNQDIPVMSIDPMSKKLNDDSPTNSTSSTSVMPLIPARWKVFSVLPIDGELPKSGNTV